MFQDPVLAVAGVVAVIATMYLGGGTAAIRRRVPQQWNRPLPDQGTYPVHLRLFLETTYADGTVRDDEVSGNVAVTVIYSSVSGP